MFYPPRTDTVAFPALWCFLFSVSLHPFGHSENAARPIPSYFFTSFTLVAALKSEWDSFTPSYDKVWECVYNLWKATTDCKETFLKTLEDIQFPRSTAMRLIRDFEKKG